MICYNMRIQNSFLYIEYAQLFAALIARTAKDVDVLIDSLPSEESTAALQVSTFTSNFKTHCSYRLTHRIPCSVYKIVVYNLYCDYLKKSNLL